MSLDDVARALFFPLAMGMSVYASQELVNVKSMFWFFFERTRVKMIAGAKLMSKLNTDVINNDENRRFRCK